MYYYLGLSHNQMHTDIYQYTCTQVHIEDNTLDVAEGDDPPPPPPQATIMEAFQHFACLYIKYVQIFKRLEMCYDAMVHPQKRIDVKVTTLRRYRVHITQADKQRAVEQTPCRVDKIQLR